MQDIITELTAKDDKYACAIADKIISVHCTFLLPMLSGMIITALMPFYQSIFPLIEKDMEETERLLTE